MISDPHVQIRQFFMASRKKGDCPAKTEALYTPDIW